MQIYHWLTRVIQLLTLLFFSALILVVMLQIVSRFMPFGFMWTEEMSRFLFIFAVAFGAPLAMEKRDYVRVDVLLGFLPTKLRKYYDAVIYLMTGLFSTLLIYYAYELTVIGQNRTSATLAVDMSYIYASMIALFLLLGLYSFCNVYFVIQEAKAEGGADE
ncbi:TRAP transporter small permease [Salibacterium aidingense]|uniref:TRAP transporter small permease n=1 Tax=Salibacterium aidingense TaxID=384933 RepID=UPI0003FDFE15|nr:TRAP transporter small permease [Salibacterium aidingense]